ncbi:MAG: AEC family transporter [Propionibacteriaceae bacterium]|nr:AEC family transporter [Propionibacteriaceae bacterium]
MHALTGFITLALLIGVGWVLAATGVLSAGHRSMMMSLAFNVASPALMCTMVAHADLERVFAQSLVVSYSAMAVAALICLAVTALVWRRGLAASTLSVLLGCYPSGNLGVPVAAYALGDVTWLAPIVLVQVIAIQPLVLALLDAGTASRRGIERSGWRRLVMPVRNPMTVGVLVGLAINLSGLTIPPALADPLEQVAGATVPLMLLAFGASLKLDAGPRSTTDLVESWFLVAVKVLLQPVAAFALARLLGLDPGITYVVTLVACLPPAQSIFIFAGQYDVRVDFTRSTIFRSTAASAVVILVVASLLSPGAVIA